MSADTGRAFRHHKAAVGHAGLLQDCTDATLSPKCPGHKRGKHAEGACHKTATRTLEGPRKTTAAPRFSNARPL
eukprot:4449860-Alexandrium_andersonii.AAC.1